MCIRDRDGTAIWGSDNNTTYTTFKVATATSAGGIGLVPAPPAGKQASFLRGDGQWVVPTNTTYAVMTGATASAAVSYTHLGQRRTTSQQRFRKASNWNHAGRWKLSKSVANNTASLPVSMQRRKKFISSRLRLFKIKGFIFMIR